MTFTLVTRLLKAFSAHGKKRPRAAQIQHAVGEGRCGHERFADGMLGEQFEFIVRRNYENHPVLAGAVDFAVGGDR